MIDTRSLYPYRNNLETYDEEHALKTDLYNHTYTFLNRGLTEIFSNYLAKNLWSDVQYHWYTHNIFLMI